MDLKPQQASRLYILGSVPMSVRWGGRGNGPASESIREHGYSKGGL